MGVEPQQLQLNGMVGSSAVTKDFSQLTKSESTKAVVSGC